MSKNAKQLFKDNKFGIRKFTVGVASVIIGTSFYLGVENQAQAAESNQTEISSSQESNSANGGNNENVEIDTSATETPMTQPSNEVTSNDTVQEKPKEEVQSNEENTTELTSNQDDALKSEDKSTSNNTVQKQPKEEVQSNEENKAETTSNQSNVSKSEDKVTLENIVQEQPKEDTTTQSNEVKQPKEETQNVAPKEENTKSDEVAPKEETTESNETVEQPKEEETTESNKVEQLKEETTESNKVEQPKEETTESNKTVEQSKEETTESNETVEQPKEKQTTESNETVEQSKEETTESNKTVEQSKEETTESNETVEQPKEKQTTESNETVEQPKEKQTTNVTENDDVLTNDEMNELESINSINTPFVSINSLSNGSVPSDDNSDTDVNALLHQPVTASRSVKPMASDKIISNNATTNSALLSSDKFKITNLTSENKDGDRNTPDTFNTHMTIQLDDSVKGGDKLEYGVKYDYKDYDGNTIPRYLKTSQPKDENGKKVFSRPIMFEGTEIGTLEYDVGYFKNGQTTPNYRPSYSSDKVNDLNRTKDRYFGGLPTTITFNDNINNLKNVEITIDDVFIKDYSDYVDPSGENNSDYLYKDTNADISNLVERNGRMFAPISNEFVINGETKDLNLELEVKNFDDKSKTDTNYLTESQLGNYNSSRTYLRTADGTEYVPNKDKLPSYSLGYSLDKDELNELTVSYTIPKALTDVADFSIASNNAPDPILSTVSSKYNPLAENDKLYVNTVQDLSLENNPVQWISNSDSKVDEDGNTIFTFTFKTEDGSYVAPTSSVQQLLKYTLKDGNDFKTSDVESYADSKTHGRNNDWGVPKWDELLKENPIVMNLTKHEKTGNDDYEIIHDKEGYVTTIRDVVTPPSGAVRVTADNEEIKEVPQSETIAYDTITRINPRLSKDDRVVIQEGVNGTHTWTDEVLYRNGEEVERNKKDEKTTPKTDEIVEIGVDQPISDNAPSKVENDVNKDIPFDTIYKLNKDLPVGSEDVVTQDGVTGIKHVKVNHKDGINYQNIDEYLKNNPDDDRDYEEILKTVQDSYKDDLKQQYGSDLTVTQDWTYNADNKEYVLSYEVADGSTTKEPQDKVIEYAPIEIDYETIEHENKDLPEGETKVIQEGHVGLKDPRTDEVLEEKENRIIEKGTGVVGQTENHVDRDIPFNVIERVNTELPKGERKVVQEGENGVERTTTTVKTLNDKPVETISTTTTTIKEPKDKIIEIGAGVEGQNVNTKDSIIPYETDTQYNKDLPEGTQRVIQEGQNGIKRVTTIETTFNGEVTDTKESVETIQEKVNEIVEIGTGVSDVKVDTVTETIPYETIERENNRIPKGVRNVIQKGVEGTRTIKTTQPTFNGEPKGEPTVETSITKQKVDEIIEVGTGIQNVRTETKTEPLKFKTDEIFDENLPEGYKEVVRKGENGEITITIKTPTLNGKDNGPSDESRVISKQPVNEIIKIGTGKLTTQTSQNAESQPFEIIKRSNPDLPKGETKVIQKGQNGLIITTIEQDYVNGKKYGEQRITTTTNKETINEIIEIGTKEPADQVKPNDPTNNKYEPKGGRIDKEFGNKTTNDEVINRVSIPDYNGEKPLIIVDDETQIPDGQTPGKYSVSVTVKYPDGSTDHTIVTVNVGEKVSSEKPLPNNKDDNNNKDNGNKDNNNNKDNDNKDANGNKINKDNNIANTSAIKNAVDKQSNELTHKSNTIQTHSTQNLENKDNINEVSNTQSVNHNDNSQTQKAISQHQNEMINKHQETQENMTQPSNKELPKTGQESNRKAGLWASMLALLGGMTLLTRRKTKKEEK